MILTAGQNRKKIRRGEDSVKRFREGLCPARINRMTQAIPSGSTSGTLAPTFTTSSPSATTEARLRRRPLLLPGLLASLNDPVRPAADRPEAARDMRRQVG